jgi:RNA polymerase-binding transcription factor DksA
MDIEQTRQALTDEENRLRNLQAEVGEATEAGSDPQVTSGDELSVVDQHPADAGTEVAQREMDMSMIEQIESQLSDVERAMEKLDDGTYGTCEACGKQIESERLEAMPATRLCIADASSSANA